MADIGQWSGSSIGSMNPTSASWAAPNGLFPTQDKNPSSIYGWASATSTLTLPSSGLADGYLLIAAFELETTQNDRFTPQGQIVQVSGTGDYVKGPTGGYARDNSEDRAYVRCWAFVNNPSASSTYQFQWKRDVEDNNATDPAVRTIFQVIPFYYADIGMYKSTDHTLMGGTTPNVVPGWTTTKEGTNITRTNNIITVTGDNKRYLILNSQFFEGRSGRTQRYHGLDIDGTQERAAMGYSYYRQTDNDENGDLFTWLIETSTANVTIEQTCYRGDGVAAGDGGADSDGNDPDVGESAMVVIELNDSAEVWRSKDGTGGVQIATTGPVDVPIARTGDIAFNDSAAFTRSTDNAVNCEKAMDILAFGNIAAAYYSTSNSRYTAYTEITKNGTEESDSFAGDYGRGNQSSTDTYGWGATTLYAMTVSSGDDVGISVTELVGSEGGGGNIQIKADWAGFGLINLDSLAVTSADSEITETASARFDIPGQVFEQASARFKAPKQDSEITYLLSARIARQNEIIELGSARYDLPGEVTEPASARIAVRSQHTKLGSIRLAIVSGLTEDASAHVARQSQATENSSAQLALQSEATEDASTRVALRSEVTAQASARVAGNGQQFKTGSARLAGIGKLAKAASIAIALAGTVTSPASARIKSEGGTLTEPASARTSLTGSINESASIRIASSGQITEEASIRISGSPFVITLSDHIDSGGEATTPQLTPPSGKTTGDHTAGEIVDDQNPLDSTDIGAGNYQESGYNLKALSGSVAAGEVYEFKETYADGTDFDQYDVYPQWTIGSKTDSQITEGASARLAGAGEVTEIGSVRVDLPSEVIELGSVRIDLPGEVTETGSVRIALEGQVTELGSARVALPGEVTELGSIRVASEGQVTELGSARIDLPSEITEVASVRINLPGQATSGASVRVASQGESAGDASIRIAGQSRITVPSSVRIDLPGQVSETSSVRIDLPSEVAEDSSARVAGRSEATEVASVRIFQRDFVEITSSGSARVAGHGEVTESGSAEIDLPGNISNPANIRITLPSAATSPGSVRIAANGEATRLGSARFNLPSRVTVLGSLRSAQNSEETLLASARFALNGEVAEVASISIGSSSRITQLASIGIDLPSQVSGQASYDVVTGSEITSAVSYRVSQDQDSEVTDLASIDISNSGEITQLASVAIDIVSQVVSDASVRIAQNSCQLAFLLLEDGGDILLEDYEKLMLEWASHCPAYNSSISIKQNSQETEISSIRVKVNSQVTENFSLRIAAASQVAENSSLSVKVLNSETISASVSIKDPSQVLANASLRIAQNSCHLRFLLLEDGSYILLEDDENIALEYTCPVYQASYRVKSYYDVLNLDVEAEPVYGMSVEALSELYVDFEAEEILDNLEITIEAEPVYNVGVESERVIETAIDQDPVEEDGNNECSGN